MARWFGGHWGGWYWWFRLFGAGPGWANDRPRERRWQSCCGLFMGSWEFWFFVPGRRNAVEFFPFVDVIDRPDGSTEYRRLSWLRVFWRKWRQA